MGKEDGKWVTIKGTHVFIPEGKRVSEVLKSKFKLQGGSKESYYKKEAKLRETENKLLSSWKGASAPINQRRAKSIEKQYSDLKKQREAMEFGSTTPKPVREDLQKYFGKTETPNWRDKDIKPMQTKGLQNAMPQRTAPKGELSGMEATNALDKLEKGMPVMVKYGKDFEPKQAIYLGRSDEGRFAFYDGEGVTGRFDFGEQWLKDNPNVSFNFEDNDPVEWNRLSQELLGNKNNKPNWDKDTEDKLDSRNSAGGRTADQINAEYEELSQKKQGDDYYYRPEDDRKLKELRAEYDTAVAKGQKDVNKEKYTKDTYGIKTLSKEESNNYVEDWSNGKDVEDGKFISEQDGKYVAIDNSTGECWVEKFDNEKDAIDYLNGTDPEEIRDRTQKNSKEADEYEKYKKMRLEDPSGYTDEQIKELNELDKKYLDKFSQESTRTVRYRDGYAVIHNGGMRGTFKTPEEAQKFEKQLRAKSDKYNEELNNEYQKLKDGKISYDEYKKTTDKLMNNYYSKEQTKESAEKAKPKVTKAEAKQVVKGLTEDKLDSGVKVKGDKNVIPRNFTKGYGKFKVETTGSNNLNDSYEITKDEYGTYHAKNLRTGETLTTFVDHLRNNNVFEFTNKTKDNYKKWSAKKPSKKSSSKYEEFLKRNK